MTHLFYFVITALLSFIFWKLVSGKHEGEQGRVHSLRFSIGRYTLWLHHWVYCAIIVVVIFFAGVRNLIVYGFLLGGILQGLTYRDFYYVFFQTQNYPFKKL